MATSRATNKSIERAMKAPFWARFGYGTRKTTGESGIDDAWDNNYPKNYASADGQSNVEALRVDADDALQLGGEAITPMRATINFPLATNASIVTQQFFIAPFPMEITGISCVFATADGAANTGYITHETNGQVPGTGSRIMTGTFDLNATANTVQTGTILKQYPSSTQSYSYSGVKLATGDRLSFVIASAVTSLAGLVISIAAKPAGKGHIAVFNMQANGDLVDQTFFIANRDYIVSSAYYCHSTKGTNGGAVNVQLVKDTGTNAPGAGTDMLTNNTNAGFDCKGTVNVVQTGALATTAGLTRLAPGDRLTADFAGTLTALAGVVMVVVLLPVQARKEVTFTLAKNGNLGVDQAFFIADRNYQITDASEVHATAAGGASKVQLTRDKATDAPGAGTDLLSNNTNAGFDLNGTANTVQVGTFVDTRFNYLMAGDRLSLDFANAVQSSAGVTVTVSLKPC